MTEIQTKYQVLVLYMNLVPVLHRFLNFKQVQPPYDLYTCSVPDTMYKYQVSCIGTYLYCTASYVPGTILVLLYQVSGTSYKYSDSTWYLVLVRTSTVAMAIALLLLGT